MEKLKKRGQAQREVKPPVADGLELRIDTCVHGGDGLARLDGHTYFVTGGLPGDLVKTGPVYQKSKCYFTEVAEVLEPSPFRRSPPCELASSCGGCDWQHVEREAQVELKINIFKDGLRRLGGVKGTNELNVQSYFGQENAYRHRAQFKLSDSGSCGFFAKKSHEVIDIRNCPVLVDELNTFAAEVREYIKTEPLKDVTQIKAMAGSKGQVASHPHLENICSEKVEVAVNGFTFEVSGQSFFQQNREMTPILGQWVADQFKGEFGLDLFGGSGFFSLMIQDKVKEVLLVERDQHLVDLARETFRRHDLSHLKAEAMSTEAFFKSTLAKNLSPATSVVVDPPRAGLGKTVCEKLSRLSIKQLIYVACDPATQARDVKWLSEMGGFVISKAALFDLYPNTHHMETVLVLERAQL
jgi:23S rRNA (uracil1939-C5)-methyltransferase